MKASLFLISLFFLSIILFRSDKINRQELSNYKAQDSELALLMREMHEQAKLLKLLLLNGEDIDPYEAEADFILEAEPTRPSVKGDEFESFARYFLKSNKDIYQNPGIENYNIMVESCVACHKEFCPGPVRTIQKLRIKAPS
jgi:hypothetical protein